MSKGKVWGTISSEGRPGCIRLILESGELTGMLRGIEVKNRAHVKRKQRKREDRMPSKRG